MDTDHHNPTPRTGRPVWLIWALAIVLVMTAWGAAIALRGTSEPVVIEGWVEGMDDGQAKAKDLDRPMIVMFTADWCPPCQQFKKKVLTQPEVKQALDDGFVAVKIDMTDTSSSNPNNKVAGKYGISGIPTLLAMSPDGEVIGKYTARQRSVETFNDWLASVK